MNEAGVSAKIPEGSVFQKFRGTFHSTSVQGLEQFMVLLKLKSTNLLKNSTIGNRLCFKKKVE